MTYVSALAALADPTRRAIVETLVAAPLPVGRLAQRFPVSRPAISQHLRVLSDAGLVTADTSGTRRIYRLHPEGWQSLRQYLDRMWDDALHAFAQEAHRQSENDTP